MSYGLPYISIWSYENGCRSRTVDYLLQNASHGMVIDWHEDNSQVTSFINAHRNDTEKISQQHSHFRIVIQKCVSLRIALKTCMRGNTALLSEITRNCLESAHLESVHPSFCFDRVLSSSSIRLAVPPTFSCLLRGLRNATAIANILPFNPGLPHFCYLPPLLILIAHVYQWSQNSHLQLAQARPHDDYHLPSYQLHLSNLSPASVVLEY